MKRNPLCLIWLSTLAGPSLAQTFTVIGLPDTQNYSESYPQIYTAQTQWAVANLSALNVGFINHYGDIVNHADRVEEWQVANQAQLIIDETNVPNSVTAGNHDITASGSSGQPYIPQNYQAFFPPTRYSFQPWWGGASPSGMSSFQVWAGGDRAFLALSVEVDTPLAELEWAQGVLDRNRDKPVLFTTHRYLQDAESYTGGVPLVPSGRYPDIWYQFEGTYQPNGIQSEQLWDWFLRRNPGIFMVNCGHFHAEFNQTSTNAFGKPVHECLADYQDDPNGGDGWLRYYQVDLAADRIQAQSYSPTLNQFRTDADSQFNLTTKFSDYASTSPVRVFQQGINGYGSTQDTWVNQASPNTAYGSSDVRVSDDDVENFFFGDSQGQALLRFDGVFGSTAVPQGAQILNATLVLELSDDIDNPLFDADFNVHRVLIPWSESSTWNSLGNGLQIGSEVSSAFVQFEGDNSPDDDFMRRINVTSFVQAWSSGSPNWGFAILPEIISGNDDGVDIRTSESGNPLLRPRLEITYVDACGASAYGVGQGQANQMALSGSGTPQVGGTFLAITEQAPTNPVTTVLSLGQASLPLLGGQILVDPAQILLQSVATPKQGIASWILKVPGNPAFAGLSFYLQSYAQDTNQAFGLSFSNGLKVTICQ